MFRRIPIGVPNRRFVLLALIAVSIHIAGAVAGAQKQSEVSLAVTIETTTSDSTTPTQVRSDGLGTYYNDVNGVTAVLGRDGNINIQFWPSSGTPSRNVWFNHAFVSGEPYSGPAPYTCSGCDGQTPATGYGTLPKLYSQPPNPALPTPYVAIQNMAVGTAQCVQFYWAYGHLDLFHYGPGLANTSNTPTAFAVVRRDSISQWTVEAPLSGYVPAGCPAADPVSLVAHNVTQKGKNTTVPDGYFYLPFRITLQSQQ